MVRIGEKRCPYCNGELLYFDHVKRYVKYKYGKRYALTIERYRCGDCGSIHRVLPSFIFPHKQYHKEIVLGVREGLITSNTLGFEDYPCSMTMLRWRTRNKQPL